MAEERMKVDVRKEDVYLEYVSLGELKNKVESYIEEYGEEATLQKYYEYGGEYWAVYVEELEDDHAYAVRKAKEKANEKWEKQQYGRLKAKYES